MGSVLLQRLSHLVQERLHNALLRTHGSHLWDVGYGMWIWDVGYGIWTLATDPIPTCAFGAAVPAHFSSLLELLPLMKAPGALCNRAAGWGGGPAESTHPEHPNLGSPSGSLPRCAFPGVQDRRMDALGSRGCLLLAGAREGSSRAPGFPAGN